VATCAATALLGFSGDTPAATGAERQALTQPGSPQADIARLLPSGSPLASFYRSRGFQPIWSGGAAALAIATMASAGDDGLDPAQFGIDRLKALAADPARRTALEIAVSQAFTDYVKALRTPSRRAEMVYVDADLAPKTEATAVLEAAAAAPSLRDYLTSVRRMHPLYERLRAELGAVRRTGRTPSSLSVASYERLLLANMDRLRALPADPGRRYVIVDTASARLWMYEDGRPRDTMRVVVGKTRLPTPALAGLIRFAVRNPYWNLPPDLMRVRAAEVVRSGPAVLSREHLEILSGWGADARVLDPAEVDWAQVASGMQQLRMRQSPGPDNMMGAVKFMFPNRLGIYLHDTPDKSVFARDDRRLSSGCVRLEDAARLGQWLFNGNEPVSWGAPEDRADLPEPVPVYILYLTALPQDDRIVVQPDNYRRDAALS
jgi:murein L,D-transpeptidase YcbB/YkuD